MKNFKWVPIVMALVTLAFTFISVSAQSLPPVPPVPVNGNVVHDELKWLNVDQVAEINRIESQLDKEGLAQIGIMIKDDCGADSVRYRNEVFNTWKIGHANKNDGLLIAVCWYGGDKNQRKVEQETGYGLEGPLPDTLTNKVAVEVFRPYFADNKPGAGIVAMVKVYDSIIRGGDYKTAIANSLKEGGLQPASESTGKGDKIDLSILTQVICGLQCFWWILIIFGLCIILYWIGRWTGIIPEGTFTEVVGDMSPSIGTDGDGDSSPFGGGISGGGGSSTSF